MTNKTCSLLVTLALPLFSQIVDTSKLPATPPPLDRHITLDVIVHDKSGKPAPGLEQNDFTVTDDKLPVKLTSFQAMKPEDPVEIVLLVDNVNAPFTQIAQVRDQVKKFISRSDGKLDHPVMLVFLSDTGTTALPPTRDSAQIIAAIDQAPATLRTVTRTQGFYGAVERFQMSMHALAALGEMEAKKPGRKLLLWIGPGWPILSGPNVHLTQKEQQQMYNSIAATSNGLRQARVVLYSINSIGVVGAGLTTLDWYKDFIKGIRNPKNVEPGNLSLQVIAVQSGGRVLNAGNDIVSELAMCVADLQSWYVLSFDSPKADAPNEYHVLDVKVNKPGLTARTRMGYYAQP